MVAVREDAIHSAGGIILVADAIYIGPTFAFFVGRTAII